MRLPIFYYAAKELEPGIWEIDFSRVYKENYNTWSGDELIGVYEAFYDSKNKKLRSISGVKSSGSISQSSFKTYARNNGSGYSLVTWSQHCIMAFLFYGWYGNTNSQGICGSGTNTHTKPTGQTDTLGMKDTYKTNGNIMSINFWGLENWWGNKFEWIDNVTIDNLVWKVTENDGSIRIAGTGYNGNGYILKLLIGDKLDMIPTLLTNSSNASFCDYYWSSNGMARVVLRSRDSSNTNGGVSCVLANNGSSNTNANYGSRLSITILLW